MLFAKLVKADGRFQLHYLPAVWWIRSTSTQVLSEEGNPSVITSLSGTQLMQEYLLA